jgi:dTDP-4-dehydrorhamnose 3,5-epimerase
MTPQVAVRPLRQFPDDRGAVLHMLRANDPHFIAFGETYFSTVRKAAVKAWHRHTRKTVNLAVPIGRIRLVLWPEDGGIQELETGRDTYQLITIAPGVWYGFQGLADGESLVANCATEPFDPAEGETLPADSDRIPYRWILPG